MNIHSYRQLGGVHCESAALRNVLAQAEARAPHSGAPWSEAMLFGLGGGLGFGYGVSQEQKTALPALSFRAPAGGGDFLKKVCRNIAVRADFETTGGPVAATTQVKKQLGAGKPVIAWGSLAMLSWYGPPASFSRDALHALVVYGWDDRFDLVCVDDHSTMPRHMTVEEFATFRGAIPALKHLTLTVSTTRKTADLKTAILTAVAECCRDMLQTRNSQTGVQALNAWADALTNAKDTQGWPRLFKPGPALYRALCRVSDCIESTGAGGGAYRTLYAEFLEEAAPLSGKAAQAVMLDAAAQFRRTAKLWSGLAQTALPENAGLLGEARDLIVARRQLQAGSGASADSQLQKINKRLGALESEIAGRVAPGPKETRQLLAAMQTQVRKIHDAESRAVRTLTRVGEQQRREA
ncbi:MAG: BtrH N-terminal domain-containing protein [Blastocatellia bacterium]